METRFGHIIKQWRGVRRFSQLSLSMESGLSSRHISFLETGRSKPTRGSVMTLARALRLPRPIVNDALLAAGLAPEYPALALDHHDLAPVNRALETIMENHAPMPAIIMDAGWNIVGGNTSAMHMMQFLPFGGSMCIVDALLNDDPSNPAFINWEVIAAWTLLRLQSEISQAGADSPLKNIYQRLAADPRLSRAALESFSAFGPVLTTHIRADGHDLRMLTMLAEFSTVQDVTMSERRVELFFAADEGTRVFFERLSATQT